MTFSRTVLQTAALFWELLHTATVTLVTSPFRMVITVVDKGTDNYFIYGHTLWGFMQCGPQNVSTEGMYLSLAQAMSKTRKLNTYVGNYYLVGIHGHEKCVSLVLCTAAVCYYMAWYCTCTVYDN